MEFITDLVDFIKARKIFWLIPAIIALILLGVIIVFSSGTAIAPFIYTIF